MGVEPERNVYGPVRKVREFNCDRYRLIGNSITPNHSSCVLAKEAEYNKDGYQVISLTDGLTTTWDYNEEGILVELRASSDIFDLETLHRQTVRNGRIVRYTSNLIRGNRNNHYEYDTKFIYDDLGYLIRVDAESTLGSQTNQFTIDFKYNRHGNLLESKWDGTTQSRTRYHYSFTGQYKGRKSYQGRNLVNDRVSNHTYNEEGQLIAYTDGNKNFEAVYNRFGERTASRLYEDDSLVSSSTYNYNSSGFLESESHYPSRKVTGSNMTDETYYKNLDAYGNWRLKYTKIGSDYIDISIRELSYH